MLGGHFLVRSHVLSIGGVILLDLNMFRELHLKLNIRPRSPMVTGIFLVLENG